MKPDHLSDHPPQAPTAQNPYAAPAAQITPNTLQEVPSYTQRANFGWRLLAYIIDSVVLNIVINILFTVVGVVAGLYMVGTQGGSTDGIESFILGIEDDASPLTIIAFYVIPTILSLILCWLYCAFMESSRLQCTLGQLAVGVRVTDAEGKAISFRRATGRFWAEMLSGIILCIGYLWMLWDEEQRTLHDKLSGCYVWKK